MKYLILFVISGSQLFGLVFDVPVNTAAFDLVQDQGYERIRVTGAITLGNPGAPEIPVVTYSFCLQVNENLVTARIVEETWQDISGFYDLYPEQPERSMEEPYVFIPPDPSYYSSEQFYPDRIIVHQSSGNLRGYRICQFSLALFRYHAPSKKLQRLVKARIEIETRPGIPGVSPRRQSAWSRSAFDGFVASVFCNRPIAPVSRVDENPEDLEPTDLPSLIGPPVDMVIVTTEDQSSAYEQYGEFKKLFGCNTVVKTMTWIKQHYDGIDDAERLRRFIADAVDKWGISQVFLGGDVPAIPTRKAWFAPLMGQYPMHIATDLYFSDLDNATTGQSISWNFDNDDKFAEIEDSVDLYPDVFVGRLPSRSPEDVTRYLYKVKGYLSPPTGPVRAWTDRALFITSDFYIPMDAYNMATRLRTHIPSEFKYRIVNEEGLQTAKDEIYRSYGMINLLSHGDINQARVRTAPREYVTNYFFDSLTNTAYPLLVLISCYGGPYEVNCLGEHWVVSDTIGGGIGFIGPSSSSSAYDHEVFTQMLFDYVYSDTLGHPFLGAGQAFAKIPFISSSQWYNWKRVFEFSLNLLGDPAIPVWDTLATSFASVTASPETLSVGFDTITLTLTPAAGFKAVYYKENEVFFTDSGSGGLIQTPLKTKTGGYLKFSVMKHGYATYIDSVYVEPSGPFAVYQSERIIDSLNNGNGEINPGEDIFLYVTLKNTGGTICQNVWARIACQDTFITIVSDSGQYANIMPGQSRENINPFHFRTAHSLPNGHWLDLRMKVHYSGAVSEDTLQLACTAPCIRLFKQSFSQRADTFSILPYLENCGGAAADSVAAFITAVNADTVTVLDSVVYFPVMAPGSISSSYPDSFKFRLVQPGTAEYFMRVGYHDAQVIDQKMRPAASPRPDSVWVTGKTRSILIASTPEPVAIGYRVFRSTTPVGPFEFINNPLNPVALYEDQSVQPNTRYYYYVTAVDSFFNESASSETAWTWTNPPMKTGWPVAVYGYLFSSPNFGDIDPNYSGLEVVTAGKDGAVYAWHCDGTPVAGDGRLYAGSGQIWSSPAIGDVDNNGSLEVVFGVRKWDPDNLWIVDNSGDPLPGWPLSLPSIISSPVLADIDGDGDLEIFVCTESGELYAFHHTGQGVYNTGGLLRQLYGWIGGTPAIADINGDERLEIVAPGGSDCDSLFVFSHDGMNLPPFPIPVMRRMQFSPVLGNVIGDEKLEICVYSDSSDCVHLIDAMGNYLWQRPIMYLGDVEAGPIIADLNRDGHPEVICGNSNSLMVLDSLGNDVAGFPPFEEHDYNLPIVADLDGNNLMDITYGTTDWSLFANDQNAAPVRGFPIELGSSTESSPAVYDIDLDSRLELMVGGNGFDFQVYDLEGIYCQWPKFRYDQYNTGTYQSGHLHIETYKSWPDQDGGRLLLSIFPTPFRRSLQITLFIPGGDGDGTGAVEPVLSIFDVTGRLVRRFDRLTGRLPGPITWHGDDERGRAVPAGVYFVRVDTGSGSLTEKAVLLK